MRLSILLKAALLSLTLSACVAPLLSMGPGQIMWALLKPMVGLDPNTTNLFEQPVIKTRMAGLLGPHYDTTVSLLRTAGELQQEGPLFYLTSRATQQTASDKAGLVWNADSNQLSVLLSTPEQTKVFSESHTGQAAVWPTTMQDWLTTAGQTATAQSAPLTTTPVAAMIDSAAGAAQPVQSELEATRAKLLETEAKLKALENEQAAQLQSESEAQVESLKQATTEMTRTRREDAMEALFTTQ